MSNRTITNDTMKPETTMVAANAAPNHPSARWTVTTRDADQRRLSDEQQDPGREDRAVNPQKEWSSGIEACRPAGIDRIAEAPDHKSANHE